MQRRKSNALVLTERQTRQEITVKIPDKTTDSVVAALDRLERRFGEYFKDVFKSITMDNGSEFADCEGMERSLFGGKRTNATTATRPIRRNAAATKSKTRCCAVTFRKARTLTT